MEKRIFAISDIHGCYKTFKSLIEEVIGLEKDDQLFLLGDYIDRGPASREVLDYIMDLKDSGYSVTALMGNHEDMLLEAVKDPDPGKNRVWHLNGGDTTLRSFGAASVKEIPARYIDFIRQMDYYTTLDKYILVHAGLNFLLSDLFIDTDSMLWARNYKVDAEKTGGKVVVHGHTPVPVFKTRKEIQNIEKGFVINIDNGCVYGAAEYYGTLTALQLDNLQLLHQKNLDS